MIGQNDVDGEVFTLADAEALTAFAKANGLGRVSMWSLNRDTACSASFADVAVHSNTCSGVEPGRAGLRRRLRRPQPAAARPCGSATWSATPPGSPSIDDPATSPYPIWRAEAQYPAGYKVVWHGYVYEARWYAVGMRPVAAGHGRDRVALGAAGRGDDDGGRTRRRCRPSPT